MIDGHREDINGIIRNQDINMTKEEKFVYACLYVCKVCTNQSDKQPTLVPGRHSLTIITGLCLWRVEGCYAHLDIHSFDDTE